MLIAKDETGRRCSRGVLRAEERRPKFAELRGLFAEVRNASHADDKQQALKNWVAHLQVFAAELLSIRGASELIRNKYFDGESVLLKDADEDLEHQTKAVELLIDRHDRLVVEAGEPERAIDSGKLQKVIQEQASYRAEVVVALAKSKMLEDFGEHEAADAEIKPYVLEKELVSDQR